MRPSQEAAGSVPSIDREADRPQAEAVEDVDLGRDPGRLGAGADDQTGRLAAQAQAAVRGSAITRPLLVGAEGDRAFAHPLARGVSTGRRSTSSKTVRSTRFISSSA